MIEPRNPNRGEPPSSSYAGAMPGPLTRVRSRGSGLAGVQEQGEWSRGFPGNLGDPDSSSKATGSGATGTANSGMIRRPGVWGRSGTNRRRSEVSPSEGNEVRRNDCQEVASPIVPLETGAPSRGTLWRKGGAISRAVGGQHVRYTETWFRVHKTPTDRTRGCEVVK